MRTPPWRLSAMRTGFLALVVGTAGLVAGDAPVLHVRCSEGAGSIARDVAGSGLATDLLNLGGAGWATDSGGPFLVFAPARASRATIPASADTDPTGCFTVMARLRPDGWTEGQVILHRAGADRQAYLLHYRKGWLWLDVDGHAILTVPPPAGVWTHLAVSYDGQGFRVFYDGLQVNDHVVRMHLPVPTGPWTVGAAPAGGGFFAGGIRDLRIYDRGLTAAEVRRAIGRNAIPEADGLDRRTVTGSTVAIPLTGRDADGTVGAWEIVRAPAHGTLLGTPPALTYRPAEGFAGTDTVLYRCGDGTDWSAPATVALTVYPRGVPVAQAGQFRVVEDTPLPITLTAVDVVGTPVWTIVDRPAYGRLTGTPPAVTYLPNADSARDDWFTFRVADGRGSSTAARITLRLDPVNDAPRITAATQPARAGATTDIRLPVLDPEDNDWLRYPLVGQPRHGTVTGIPPHLRYTPAGGFTGIDSLAITVSDGVNPPVSGTVTIAVQTLPTVNVRDRGAIGDGIADDTLAIRAAIAEVENAGGGTIYFPSGTYAVAPRADDPSWVSNTQPLIFDLSGHNIELRGDGPDRSIISAYTIGLADPQTTWTVIGDGTGYARIKRGGGFKITTRRVAKPTNIAFRGLRITGNTRATGDHTVGGIPGTGDGWDLSHKGIALWDIPVDNILIEHCRLDGWRGEVVYAGGDSLDRLTIRDTLIHDSNASAISCGGNVLCERVTVRDVYNGFENYCLKWPQQTIVRDCLVEDAYAFGIVYLGVGDTRFTVTGSTVRRSGQAGIFVSEFAKNVLVRGNTFEDNQQDLYAIFLNQYATQRERGFEGVLFQGNACRTVARSGRQVFSQFFGHPARFWTMRDNMVTGAPGLSTTFISEGFSGGLDLRRNFVVCDNTLTDVTRPGWVEGKAVRALWYDNTIVRQGWFADRFNPAPVHQHLPLSSVTETNHFPSGQLIALADAAAPAVGIPVGFEFTWRFTDRTTAGCGELPIDPAWNTFARGYILYRNATIGLRLNPERRWDVISYTGPTGTAPDITTGSILNANGFAAVAVKPAAATTFTDHRGIGENTAVDLVCAANTTIASNDRIRTPSGAAIAVAGRTIRAVRAGLVLHLQNGAIPATPPAPVVIAGAGTARPTLAGTSVSGATITVRVDGAVVATTTAGPDGSWQVRLPVLPAGPHDITVTATNSDGSSAPSPTLVVSAPAANAAPVIAIPATASPARESLP